MKVDVDYKFSMGIFLKNDPEQVEYLLSRIILEPKGRITLEIMGPDGEFMEIPEILTTKEKDMTKTLGIENKEED
jgi:hypothetical protein